MSESRSIGSSGVATGGTGSSMILVMTVAGFLGGATGFGLSEWIQGGEENRFFSDSLVLSTGFWFMLAVIGIGGALSATQGFIEKDVTKSRHHVFSALPALVIGGFIAGALAQNIFASLLEGEFDDPDGRLRMARAVGWGIAGTGAGLAVGVGFRSAVRSRNGALGGLGGGLIGGYFFDSISSSGEGNASTSRLVGMILIGTITGLLIGLLDKASTDMYLEVASGEFRGRQFVLFDQSSIIGCARSVPVTILKDPLVTEHHARVTKASGGVNIEGLKGAGPISINGQPVQGGFLPLGGQLQVGNTVLVLGGRRGSSTRSAAQATPANPAPVIDRSVQPQHGAERAQSQTPRPAARPTIQMNQVKKPRE
jgi:hypothetical protein